MYHVGTYVRTKYKGEVEEYNRSYSNKIFQIGKCENRPGIGECYDLLDEKGSWLPSVWKPTEFDAYIPPVPGEKLEAFLPDGEDDNCSGILMTSSMKTAGMVTVQKVGDPIDTTDYYEYHNHDLVNGFCVNIDVEPTDPDWSMFNWTATMFGCNKSNMFEDLL